MPDITLYVSTYLENLIAENKGVAGKIEKLDTTALAPGIFRIHNSQILGIMEYQNHKKEQIKDQIFRRGINILHELFTHPNEVILFLGVNRGELSVDDFSILMKEWNKYFYLLVQEKGIRHDIFLRISFRKNSFCFVLVQ